MVGGLGGGGRCHDQRGIGCRGREHKSYCIGESGWEVVSSHQDKELMYRRMCGGGFFRGPSFGMHSWFKGGWARENIYEVVTGIQGGRCGETYKNSIN